MAVLRRAGELASSGVHISSITIASALAAEGIGNAEEYLSDPTVRKILNDLCAQHWKPPAVVVDMADPDDPDAPPHEHEKPAH